MEVSRINCGVPFKAQVESQSPLVSGNWAYLSDNGTAQDNFAPQKKKSGFWKKALIAAAAVVAVGIALAQTRKLSSIDAVMKKGSFKELQGFGEKVKYVIGKGGDYANKAYDCTIGKLLGMFKGKGADGVKPDAPKPDTPKPSRKPRPARGKKNGTATTGGKKNNIAPAGNKTNNAAPAGGKKNTTATAGNKKNNAAPAGGKKNNTAPAGNKTNNAAPAGGKKNTIAPVGGKKPSAKPTAKQSAKIAEEMRNDKKAAKELGL